MLRIPFTVSCGCPSNGITTKTSASESQRASPPVLGAKKDHLLRSEVLHQALRESLQSLAGHKGGGIGGYSVGWPVPAFAGRGVCLRLACTFNPTVERNLTMLRVDPLMGDDPAMMRWAPQGTHRGEPQRGTNTAEASAPAAATAARSSSNWASCSSWDSLSC